MSKFYYNRNNKQSALSNEDILSAWSKANEEAGKLGLVLVVLVDSAESRSLKPIIESLQQSHKERIDLFTNVLLFITPLVSGDCLILLTEARNVNKETRQWKLVRAMERKTKKDFYKSALGPRNKDARERMNALPIDPARVVWILESFDESSDQDAILCSAKTRIMERDQHGLFPSMSSLYSLLAIMNMARAAMDFYNEKVKSALEKYPDFISAMKLQEQDTQSPVLKNKYKAMINFIQDIKLDNFPEGPGLNPEKTLRKIEPKLVESKTSAAALPKAVKGANVTHQDIYLNSLVQVRGLGAGKAKAIASAFPSPIALAKFALENTKEEFIEYISNLKYQQKTGREARVGKIAADVADALDCSNAHWSVDSTESSYKRRKTAVKKTRKTKRIQDDTE